MKKVAYVFLFCLSCSVCNMYSQNKQSSFLQRFSASHGYDKIAVLASYPYNETKADYPAIRDSLNTLRRLLMVSPESEHKPVKFLLAKIDAGRMMFEKDYTQAILIQKHSLKYYAGNISDSIIPWVFLKNSYLKIGNQLKALEIQYLIERNRHRIDPASKIYFGLPKSIILLQIGLKEQAVDARKAEFKQQPNKDTSARVYFYNDLGVFYNGMKRSDSALTYLLKAKELLRQKSKGTEMHERDMFYAGLIDGNIAISHINNGDFQKALPLLENDVRVSIGTANYESAFKAFVQLARCQLELKNATRAKRYIDSATVLLNGPLKKNIPMQLELFPIHVLYLTFAKKFQESAKAQISYQSLLDSVSLSEKKLIVENQRMVMDIEQKEFGLEKREQVLQEMILEKTTARLHFIYMLITLFVLLLIILLLIFIIRKHQSRSSVLSKTNVQIQTQHSRIQQSLKEKDALIKEIHHRVKNNLQIITSMLNLQSGKLDDEKIEAVFAEAKQRINAIALTHQMLYQKNNLSKIRLNEYLGTLVKQLESAVPQSRIKLVTEIPPTTREVSMENAIPIALMINELLTNAYKHAFPGNREGVITVSLVETSALSYSIKVSDNGIGLPENFNPRESYTFGMELITILIGQLNAKLKIENKGGSTFIIEMTTGKQL